MNPNIYGDRCQKRLITRYWDQYWSILGSIFKIDFFPKNWKKFLGLFWFWNYSWWSILWPEKIFMGIVHIGFKNRQKVVFVSLKKHQKVDYLHRNWLFSNFLFWFEFLSWRYIFPENLACTRLFFTKIDFFEYGFHISPG